MLTATEICNRALDKLGAEPINSIEAPTLINEKRLARIYPITKARELKRHRWVFAKTSVRLSPKADKALSGLYVYALPTDCLRPLRDDNTTWTANGRDLHDSGSGPLLLDYIANVAENLFDPSFVEVLACKLAEELAEPIAQSPNKKQQARQDWLDALAEARRDNAFIVGEEDLQDSDVGFGWVTERF